MQCFEITQVAAIGIGTTCQALEPDYAGQSGDPDRLSEKLYGLGTLGDGLEIQRRESAAHEVHNPIASIDAQTWRIGHISGREDLVVAQALRVRPLQEAQDRRIGLGPIRHKQITVLGRANMTVVDHTEAAYNDIVESGRLSVRDDASEVRTRELV